MNWLKLHHGTPSDPKWAVIAKRAGVPRCAVVAVWCAILDHASQNTPRGSTARLDVEMIAVSLDLETEQAQAIVTAMTERGIIDNETVTNWQKRQTGTSTERVRRFRERSSPESNADETHNETTQALRNGDETIEKRRTEEIREDSLERASAPPSKPLEFANQVEPIPDFLDRRKQKRRSRLDAEFVIEVDDGRYRYATDHGMTDSDIANECEKFENHHRAKGSVMADWDAAWRTWVGNWVTFSQKKARA